ncbi:MAG TPA: hypothetical protein V6D12_10790, partial [Candidatus Obscuribacterales bacterium]
MPPKSRFPPDDRLTRKNIIETKLPVLQQRRNNQLTEAKLLLAVIIVNQLANGESRLFGFTDKSHAT